MLSYLLYWINDVLLNNRNLFKTLQSNQIKNIFISLITVKEFKIIIDYTTEISHKTIRQSGGKSS